MRHLPTLPNELVESILDLLNIDDIKDKFLLYAIFGTKDSTAVINTRNSIPRFLRRLTSKNMELLHILLATNTIIGGWNVINYFNPGVYNGNAAWELYCGNTYYDAVTLILLLENIGFEFSTSISYNCIPHCNESVMLNYYTYSVITGHANSRYKCNPVQVMYSSSVRRPTRYINASPVSATRCYISGYGAVSYDYHFTKIGEVNKIQDYIVPKPTTREVGSKTSNTLMDYVSSQQANINQSTLTSVSGSYMHSEISAMNGTNYNLQARKLSDPYSFTIPINEGIYTNSYTNYICSLKYANVSNSVWTVDSYGSVSIGNKTNAQYYSELDYQVAAKLLLHYNRDCISNIRGKLSEIISDEKLRHWINKWTGKPSKVQSQVMLQYVEMLYA